MHTREESRGVLKISGTLDIADGDALREALRTGLQRESALVLDLTTLEGCDTAALQLLFSARNSAFRLGKNLEVSTGPALESVCADLGLTLKEPQTAKAGQPTDSMPLLPEERGSHGCE